MGDEDAKIKAVEEDDLTPHQRYSKLCELLSKSKFYSNFLLEKMEKEDEESKNLKNKNLAGRKTRKEDTIDQVTKKYPKRGRSTTAEEEQPRKKKKYEHERKFDGEPIPDD